MKKKIKDNLARTTRKKKVDNGDTMRISSYIPMASKAGIRQECVNCNVEKKRIDMKVI